jgi:hypothetical protein
MTTMQQFKQMQGQARATSEIRAWFVALPISEQDALMRTAEFGWWTRRHMTRLLELEEADDDWWQEHNRE